MGVLKVLGLQLCLLVFSLGSEARSEWQGFDTKDTDEEPNSKLQPPMFETGYEGLRQDEASEFGLEMKHQDPQDFDIMLMTHRVRRSGEKKKKEEKNIKKSKGFQTGKYSPLGSTLLPDMNQAPEAHRVRRSEEKTRKRIRVGAYATLGSTVPANLKQASEVVRAKRQLKESGPPPKKQPDRPGKFSVLNRESPPTPVPTESLN